MHALIIGGIYIVVQKNAIAFCQSFFVCGVFVICHNRLIFQIWIRFVFVYSVPLFSLKLVLCCFILVSLILLCCRITLVSLLLSMR
ncbi:Uncharacterised protein [Mycobacteroides abscessus subsp. abscessus]|nr:Uncharacterised protein [Mycobacteroides abscessus subsp. abscessus]